jgi:hypothetical protein
LQLSNKWKVTKTSLVLQGWACYVNGKPATVSLHVDDQPPIELVANQTSHLSDSLDSLVRSLGTPCPGSTLGRFSNTFMAATGQPDFMTGKHKVAGKVVGGAVLGDSPGCINNGVAAAC